MIPLPEFVARLRKSMDDAREEIAANIMAGQPETLADFKEAIGQVAGITTCRQMLDDLVKHVNEGG